jgi:hypothetical protein
VRPPPPHRLPWSGSLIPMRGRADKGLSHFAPTATTPPRSLLSPIMLSLHTNAPTATVRKKSRRRSRSRALTHLPRAVLPSSCRAAGRIARRSSVTIYHLPPRDLLDAIQLQSLSGAATTSPSSAAPLLCLPTTSPVPPNCPPACRCRGQPHH